VEQRACDVASPIQPSRRGLDDVLCRRFRGVRTVYPSPVTRRSASFRLRFRFVRVVRAVRAGEAKLRGRMTNDVLIAGPPGCWDRCAWSLPFAALLLLLFVWF
jgi:hypothetical protein